MENSSEKNQEKSQEVSPTIQNILDGKAKITYLKDDMESRTVGGHKYIGHYYLYKLDVPSPVKEGEMWETYLTTWSPSSVSKKNYVELPDIQITISTGHGEMPISGNQEIIDKIYKEIMRQMNSKE